MPHTARRLYTAPNLLSFGRLLLLVPLFVFLRQGERGNGNLWALGIMGAALLTDWLDGLIARHFGQESDWGKVLDPLADKVWIGCLALFLAMPWRVHPLPLPFFLLMMVRDVSIVSGAVYAFRRTGIIMTSNWFGKVAMVAEALTLLIYTIYRENPVVPGLLLISVVWFTSILIFISGFSYVARMRRVLAQARQNAPISPTPTSLNTSS